MGKKNPGLEVLLLRDSLVDTFTSSEGPRVSGLEIEEGNKFDTWNFKDP